MAVSISLSITQNSQSVANNTSSVTVKVTASWTGGSNNRVVNASGTPQANGWVKIDGTSYTFASTFNDNQTTTGSKVVCTKTVTVKHNSDGTKTLACSASYTTGVSSGTVTASASKTLTTIPRASELTIPSTTLNTKQTLTVKRKSDKFTHTVKVSCGSIANEITVCTKSSDTSLEFTPPIEWAKYNTTGTYVRAVYSIATYNGNSLVDVAKQYSVYCTIPASVKPSCSIAVSDPNGWAASYGDYIKGQSKLYIKITPTLAYDSPISTYKITADGTTYSNSSVTTGFVKNVGQQTITAEVIDKRGRKGTASVTVNVLDYSLPVISSLSVHRCNEDGTLNDQGDWVQVSFDATVSNPKGANGYKNECGYIIETKKSSDEEYSKDEIVALTNAFEVSDALYNFPADNGSSYDIRLTAYDAFGSYTKTTSVSTAYTIMHWKASGRGMAIGKVSELDDVLDINMQTRLLGGILYTVIEPETDLNDVLTPGFYVGENVSDYNYGNCPITSGTFTLEVLSGGDYGQTLQRLTRCHKTAPQVYERWYYTNDWYKEGDEYVWFGGWVYPEISSEFVVYSGDGSSPPMCRKDGRIVEVRGIVKPAVDIAGDTNMHTICTLPTGYRPSSPIYTICQGSSNCTWLLRVNTSGTVDMSRYRNGETSATASVGTWLPFQVTFLV